MMRIATASVNGIRAARAGGPRPELRRWLRETQPDIVALQKVRVWEDEFPRQTLDEIGYHSRVHGKAFPRDYGVAVLSRKELPEPQVLYRGLPGAEADGARFLTVDIGGLRVSSVYAPYGNPDKPNKKGAIERRVAWLRLLVDHVRSEDYARRDSVLAGDFNVKPDGTPRSSGYFSERERRELADLRALGFDDLYRKAHPDGKPGFTYGFTDAWPEGTSRLHLALASSGLARRLSDVWVDVESRLWKGAAPVVADLDHDI